MTHLVGNSPLERSLKPGHFLFWQGRRYRLLPGDSSDPLTIQVEDIATLEQETIRMEELLLPEGNASAEPVFAPTLEALQRELEQRNPPSKPVNANSLPEHLRRKADRIIAVVETVERLVSAEEGRALLHNSQQKFQRTPALKRACLQLTEPVSLATYYNYRRLYQRWQGDRNQVAAALRRSTFNQTRMSPDQLHFVDTHIMRFYARSRSIRPSPKTLREIMQSTLQRTNGLWLSPDLYGDNAPQNLIEELLDPKLPMAAILDNPEKAGLLKPIELPSRSWLYQYLRWFTHQPEHGRAVMTARYGQEMWEREQLIFDTFVRLAMMPLQYVFADHWLVDVFTVDEATRSKINRLWLTLLLDAYSRSVLGMALLYETPCIDSIQSALRHAIWPKISHYALGITGEWICYGIPQQLSLDNAWAHHSGSLANLARAISQNGRYNSIDLIFRPPYKGRYGALIERLFGNLSVQVKELLPGAIQASDPRSLQQAAREACLLYEDLYRFFQETIVVYQHTPHHELGGMTPHEKWLEGMQFGPPLVPPLTPAIDQLFWRMGPEPRVITNKGVAAFGMHYWSPDLQGVSRVGWDRELIHYRFSYDPADISRIALFRDGKQISLLEAKELRQADGSTMAVSLWEQQLAKAMAQKKGYSTRDWLKHVYELDELHRRRLAEKKKAHQMGRAIVVEAADAESQAMEPVLEQAAVDEAKQSYTEWLANFVDDRSTEPFNLNQKELNS
jgi:hypothetical protein